MTARSTRPLFVVLEGIDGAGTTTQTERLVAHLAGAGAATPTPPASPAGAGGPPAARDAGGRARPGPGAAGGRQHHGPAVRGRSPRSSAAGDRSGARRGHGRGLRPLPAVLAGLPGRGGGSPVGAPAGARGAAPGSDHPARPAHGGGRPAPGRAPGARSSATTPMASWRGWRRTIASWPRRTMACGPGWHPRRGRGRRRPSPPRRAAPAAGAPVKGRGPTGAFLGCCARCASRAAAPARPARTTPGPTAPVTGPCLCPEATQRRPVPGAPVPPAAPRCSKSQPPRPGGGGAGGRPRPGRLAGRRRGDAGPRGRSLPGLACRAAAARPEPATERVDLRAGDVVTRINGCHPGTARAGEPGLPGPAQRPAAGGRAAARRGGPRPCR